MVLTLFASCSLFPVQEMTQQAAGAGRRYLRAFVSGFFVAVPVTVTVLDRVAYVARVEGASMQVRRSTHQRLHEPLMTKSFSSCRDVIVSNIRPVPEIFVALTSVSLELSRRLFVIRKRCVRLVGADHDLLRQTSWLHKPKTQNSTNTSRTTCFCFHPQQPAHVGNELQGGARLLGPDRVRFLACGSLSPTRVALCIKQSALYF